MANQSNDFNTPPELIKPIKEFFGGTIELDPCSNKHSMVKAVVEWTLPINGLTQNWHKVAKTVFVNPPYAPYYLSHNGLQCLTPQGYGGLSQEHQLYFDRYTINSWILKCIDEGISYCESIMLIPARGMGSIAWQKYVFPFADGICFLNKRYPFWEKGEPCKGPDGKVNPPQFDCALVYFGKRPLNFKSFFLKYGWVVLKS